MVAWRHVAGLSPMLLLDVYNNNNTLAMTRGFSSAQGSPSGRAFVAINSGPAPCAQAVQTMMPAGIYCNIVAQGSGAANCYPCKPTCPYTIMVNGTGHADITLAGYQALAFHINSVLAWAPYPFKHAALFQG